MITREQRIVTTSWDDGHPCDSVLAEILTHYGIRATFYVPLSNWEREVMTSGSLVELSAEFEIGAHTRTHVDLRRLDDWALYDEVCTAKQDLENLLGKPVHMFCYPRGKHNKMVRQAVSKSGYIGARTTTGFCSALSWKPFEMPTTFQFFPHPNWLHLRHEICTRNMSGVRRAIKTCFGKTWIEIAQRMFDDMIEKGGVWHLWGHSWEIQEYNLWDDLRRLLEYVAHREGVVYLTNGQLSPSVAAYHTT